MKSHTLKDYLFSLKIFSTELIKAVTLYTWNLNKIMAKIINTKTQEEIEIKDTGSITEACEKVGVPLSCNNGICGTCMIDIVSGQDNLSELTEEEKDLGRDKKHRLACQCKIKQGNVEIDF